MQRWRAAGNQVVGLQVDFDAATYQLADYAQFCNSYASSCRQSSRWG